MGGAKHIEQRLARTYDHPSYENPYDAVRDYRRVQRAVAKYPTKGSYAISNIVELPRSRIRGWVDENIDGMPDAARAISVAKNKGWLKPSGDTAVALATLAGHLIGGGSISKRNYVPSVCEGRRVSLSEIEHVFHQLTIKSRRRHENSNNRATEVIPAEYASILGRIMAVWGCPVGGRSEVQSLPELCDCVSILGREAFIKTYIKHRAVDYKEKATSRLGGEQPESFHRSIAELIEAVTGESASYNTHGVTVSASAMRALNLDE